MNITLRAVKSLLDFLDRNPFMGYLHLIIEQRSDYTSVVFDDQISRSPSHDWLQSLPTAKYRGAAATALWQALHELNLANDTNHHRDVKLDLAPDDVHALEEYLDQQCIKLNRLARLWQLIEFDYSSLESLSLPEGESHFQGRTGASSLTSPHQKQCLNLRHLVTECNRLATYLNNDVEEDLRGYSALFTSYEYYREWVKENSLTWANENSSPFIHDYGFDDAVRLHPITDKPFHPFTFAGLWITAPLDTHAPLQASVAMHDFRRPHCTTFQAAVDYFTDQVCLFLGVEHLYLDAAVWNWAKEVSQPHPTRLNAFLVPAVDLKREFLLQPDSSILSL